MRHAIWSAGWLAALAAAAHAQGMSLGEPAVPVALQGKAPDTRVRLGARAETWRSEMEFDDSETAPIMFDAEQGVDFFTQHNAVFLTLDVVFTGVANVELYGHAGLGYESITTTLELDATSAIGGPDQFDTRFEDNVAWEAGVGAVFDFVGADAGILVLYRGGAESEAENRPPDEEFTYEYWMLRVAGEVGVQTPVAVRPFLGVRFTMYEGVWLLEDPTSGFEIEYTLEFDQPVGVYLGADLTEGAVTARVQLEFVDVETVGASVSAGISF